MPMGEYFPSHLPTRAPLGVFAGLGAAGDTVCYKQPSNAVIIGAGVVMLGVGAVMGRAMTPPGKSKGLYTALGAGSIILGPLGITILAVASLMQRGR